MVLQETDNSALVKQFQNYLLIDKGLSENSIFSYTYDLKKFQNYLKDTRKKAHEVQIEDVTNFLKEQKTKQISARSIARTLAALRQFYSYLQNEKQIDYNPVEEIETPNIKKTLPEYLSLEEVDELFQAIDEEDIYELRDKTMFELMYSSGLRITEACTLKLSHIDLEKRFVEIHGKSNRQRLVPFGEKSYESLYKYLSSARKRILRQRESEYVFISKKSDCLNRKSAWRLLKKYLSRTSITKSVTPHTFRHSFATHLIKNNADIRFVQELLGHIDISTTQVYTHVAGHTLKDMHGKYHPRA